MSLFETHGFRQVIESVYRLRTVRYELSKELPLYRPRVGRSLIYLPIGFFSSRETQLSIEQFLDSPVLHNFLQVRGLTVRVNFVERHGEPSGLTGNDIWCKTHVSMTSELSLVGLTSSLDVATRHHVRNVKKERNKVKRNGISFSWATDDKDLRQFYAILSHQYLKQHRMLFQPIQLFTRLFSLGVGHLAVARHDGQIVAGMFMTFDGSVWRYNWGARQQFNGVSTGTILMDWVLEQAISASVTCFDFGASSVLDTQLLKSKERWGADHFPVYRYSTNQSEKYFDLHTSLRRSRWILTRIPASVARPFAKVWAPLTVQ